MKKEILAGALATLLAVGMVGCTPEGRDKFDAAGEKSAEATKATGDAISTDASKSGEAVANGAKAAGQAVANTAENTKKAADNAALTLKIKQALLTATDLKTRDLNVDTMDGKVALRGSVTNQDQKDRAQKIAEGIAGKDMPVTNQLTIDGQK